MKKRETQLSSYEIYDGRSTFTVKTTNDRQILNIQIIPPDITAF